MTSFIKFICFDFSLWIIFMFLLFLKWYFFCSGGQNLSTSLGQVMNPLSADMSKFQRSINEGDFEFLKYLSYDDLTLRMSGKFISMHGFLKFIDQLSTGSLCVSAAKIFNTFFPIGSIFLHVSRNFTVLF
jgi:hypothetical protein